MIDVAGTLRRLFLAGIAIAIAGTLLRPQLSSALVTRGDDAAFRGDVARARVMYRRALAFDMRNAVAADRLIFSELMTHERGRVRGAIGDATAFLARDPANGAIRMDRALALQLVKDYARASRDFAFVGALERDPRALTFAGLDALHAGDRDEARLWLREALHLAPHDEPARRALLRSRS